MKKHVSILLGLLVVFSSLFTSCNEEELDPNICKITVKSEGNGKVSITDYIGTSVNVLIGNHIEVVATPDDGWAFIGWYISGTESPVSTDASFTFITSENVTLTARFAKLSDIIIRSGGNGSVAFKNASGNSIPVLPGAEVTVIATPNEDCDFVGWFIEDSETPVSTEAVYTFTATENIVLTGQFSKRPVVTVQSAGNGSVSIKDTYWTNKAFLPGTEVTVIATPYTDCDFIGWFVADAESPISTDIQYTFIVTEDIALTARFNKRPVITIHSVGSGNVSFEDHPGTSIAVLPNTDVTVIATPNENCDFLGWFMANEEFPISTDLKYAFIAIEDITLIAMFKRKFDSNGHEYIDLGLPSGLKWGTCNVGATNPEEYGGYYAWGEIEEKEKYDWNTYKWCNGSYYTQTKYCTSSSYGTVDNKTTLDPEDDVAHVKWGGTWRMPTLNEQIELLNYCTWTWTTQNGVIGYIITGPNGNSIFLPAAGYRHGFEVRHSSALGYYWASDSNFREYACNLYLLYNSHNNFNEDRCYGLSVRPVSE